MKFWQVYGLMLASFALGQSFAIAAGFKLWYSAFPTLVLGLVLVGGSTWRMYFRVERRSRSERGDTA